MDKIQAMDNMPRPSSLRKLLNRIQGLSIWMHLFRGMFPSSDRKWRDCDSKDIFWDPWDLLTTHNMAAFSSVDILAVLRNLRVCPL
uniref:Uncharacterized protein n=1 Tax=Lepeophtheirus salmonis TaxID=72036 RepID=A0A0K2U199_LEPSM